MLNIEPNRSWWEVKLWWRSPSDDSWESGGHFAAEPGDTVESVIRRVAEARAVDLDACTEVSIKLHQRY